MTAALDCPDLASWRALFDDALPADQRERYERHLESCPACQERLDQAEPCDEAERTLVRCVGSAAAAPPDATLSCFLERLHEGTYPEGPAPAEPTDLDFLGPADRPGLLGMLGDYEVQAVLGQGGMGVVLQAFEPALHRLVAIKVLTASVAGSSTARRRFTREARAAAAVCHEHVVAVHGVSETNGLPYLVMQYVAGESLQERLDRTGPLEVTEVVRIGLQTASGLAAAHAQGLIHRDVKPANLLLENGLAKVKITDFGLARTADDLGLTQSGVVAGTPAYMAPEQARGEPVDHRADLFSLGSVLYALCAGAPPFRGPSAVAVLRQVSDREPAPLRALNPEVPAWLEALVGRLLAKDPAKRFQSAAEVATLLEGYLAHLRQPTTVPAPELPSRAARGGRGPSPRRLRRRLRLPALVLLVGLGLGMALWLAGSGGAPEAKKEPFQEYYHAFKDHPDDRQGLELIGPDADDCVKFEPEGLRITLPAGYAGPPGFHGERPDTGVVIPVAVKGDFEITVGFEVLQEPEPEDAGWPQTRLTLDAGVNRATNTVTTLSRRVEKTGGANFLTWLIQWDEAAGKHESKFDAFPAREKTGRLRLVRSGTAVSYFASEGAGDDFRILQQYPFNGEDLEDVRVVGSTGAGPKAALDARVTDVRIRAASLANLPGGAVPLTDVPGGTPRTGGKGWVVILSASLLGLTFVVGLLIAVARRRPAGKVPVTPVVAEQAQPEAAAPFVAFPCPGCGKGLRARAQLAGKKLKCPKCGQAVHVPETGTRAGGSTAVRGSDSGGVA